MYAKLGKSRTGLYIYVYYNTFHIWTTTFTVLAGQSHDLDYLEFVPNKTYFIIQI